MHREITYVLATEEDIERSLKGFIYSALAWDENGLTKLFKDIPESKKYEYELTPEIIKKFQEWFNYECDSLNTLNWIISNLDSMEIEDKVKYKFLSRLIEILSTR